MNEEEKKESEKKKLGAKELSKGAMVLSTLWLVLGTLAVGIFKLNLTVRDIILVAVALVLIWSPTYASMYMDKFLNGVK